MIEDVENERVLEELQDGEYGTHSIDSDELEDIIKNGASAEYEDTGELLTDISTAAQRIEMRDTRERSSDLVEEYCSKLNLSNKANQYGETILDYLNEETILDHEEDALAGASTYVSSLFTNEKVTMDEVERVVGIGNSRFRSAYEDVKSQVTGEGVKPVSDLHI